MRLWLAAIASPGGEGGGGGGSERFVAASSVLRPGRKRAGLTIEADVSGRHDGGKMSRKRSGDSREWGGESKSGFIYQASPGPDGFVGDALDRSTAGPRPTAPSFRDVVRLWGAAAAAATPKSPRAPPRVWFGSCQ